MTDLSKPRWWQTRRVAAENYAKTLETALVEVMRTVTTEIDPEPGPWEAYATSRKSRDLLRILHEADHD